ncbi:MAG: hypothetical protein HZA58_09300 [Acidimicrobiia bacterium]|nr:hypothetical protein [Acidimicrobiia bacterium]
MALVVGALAACGDDAADTTTTTEPPGDTGRVAVGPPISVDEALSAGDDRPHLVRGYLFVYADGTMVLADVILESFPPQPGGATIPVVGFSVEGMAGLQEAPAGSALAFWVNAPIEILGTVADGVLTYFDDPTA